MSVHWYCHCSVLHYATISNHSLFTADCLPLFWHFLSTPSAFALKQRCRSWVVIVSVEVGLLMIFWPLHSVQLWFSRMVSIDCKEKPLLWKVIAIFICRYKDTEKLHTVVRKSGSTKVVILVSLVSQNITSKFQINIQYYFIDVAFCWLPRVRVSSYFRRYPTLWKENSE